MLGTYRATKSDDYVQAAAFAGEFPEPCLLLGDSGVGSNLRYHFGRPRGLIVRNVPLMIDADASFPANRGSRYLLSETECLVVEVKRLVPGYEPLPGFDGRSHRQVWFRYLEWVFDLQTHDDGSLEYRRPRATQVGEELYLQLGPGRDRAATSEAFFRRLDELIGGRQGTPKDEFSLWWSEGDDQLRDGPER